MDKNSISELENPGQSDWFNILKRAAPENEESQGLNALDEGIVLDGSRQFLDNNGAGKFIQTGDELPGVRQEKRSSACEKPVAL